ncbi:hypothetical protein IWQ61_009039 [Dispira simplex]|nr:hypothetical protein IWQ61_009039 [Dispira simplex]
MGKSSKYPNLLPYNGFSSTYFQERITSSILRGYNHRPNISVLQEKPDGQRSFLRIALLQKPVFIQTTDSHQPAGVIRGYVLLYLAKPTRFTNITLSFQGKLKACWLDTSTDYATPHEETHQLINCHRPLLQTEGSPQQLPTGLHQFDFELVLPGDLMETIHTHHLSVVYKLKVLARRPRFKFDMRDTEYVAIKRQPSTWTWGHLNSLNINNVWKDQIQYDIFLPIRSCTDDETIDLSFKFLPMDPIIRVLNIQLLLKEYVRYKSPLGKRKEWTQIISQTRASNLINFRLSSEAAVGLTLKIPDAYETLQYDTATDTLEITHKVKCVMQFRDRHLTVHNVYIAIPFVITPKTMENLHDLPAYDTLEQETLSFGMPSQPPPYEGMIV